MKRSFCQRPNRVPNIRFINLNRISSCSINLQRDSYNFLFLLEDSLHKKPSDLCLNRFANKDTLIISDFYDQSIPSNYKSFLVTRNDDKFELLKFMNFYSNYAMIIDNETTKDKYEIGEFWKKR